MYTVEYEKNVEGKYRLTVYSIHNKRVVLYSVFNGLVYVLTSMKIIESEVANV